MSIIGPVDKGSRTKPLYGKIGKRGGYDDGSEEWTNRDAGHRHRRTDTGRTLTEKIDEKISFGFVYEILAPYYPSAGRPSVDPVSMFKMLEVQLNLVYRWFCGFELGDAIPDHSTFSKTRARKWNQSDLFQKAFQEIVKRCIAGGLVDGKAMAADGSYLPSNVSRDSAFYRGHSREGTPEYMSMMRLRKIWAEGSFSAMKREHCFSKIRKRGISAATEECLLSAMALNLKRMVNTKL